ncbi:MAG: hypothetical protein M3Y57_19865, partial [Acidobacteriota bacterium]|nr:hypothetical protein [Acidobacteriota bacterium]
MGWSKLFYNDTPRKLLEDALTRSNEALTRYAAVVSHDLQEPLRTINCFAALLASRNGDKLDAEANELLRLILDSSTHMGKLVSDLLKFALLDSEKPLARSVHLDDDLEAAVSLLRALIDESGGSITHNPLPNVEVDRGQMVRLFQNLLGNALKFRKPGQSPLIH